MTTTLRATLLDRVRQIEAMPAIPAVFLPLLELMKDSSKEVPVDEVVRLVSYDNTIAAQCLRVASSPLFGLAQAPKSIKGAVMSLGLRRVETILLTCCLGQAFPAKRGAPDPVTFWRHSLGCAMVCRKFSEKVGSPDCEKAHMAGLLHDIGFMVNCLAFSGEFAAAMEQACAEEVPLEEAERATMGFTHCESGEALAQQWQLAADLTEVIACHHNVETSHIAAPLVAIVHLSDLLCRMRGLGYGYYERQKVDFIADPAWAILSKEYAELANIDLVRFTFELDEAVQEIHALVHSVFGASRN